MQCTHCCLKKFNSIFLGNASQGGAARSGGKGEICVEAIRVGASSRDLPESSLDLEVEEEKKRVEAGRVRCIG